MDDLDNISRDQYVMLKHWLFKENIRIEQEKQQLLKERLEYEQSMREFEKVKEAHHNMHEMLKKQLVREKKLFEQKWQILQRELRLLAYDKEKLKSERETLALAKQNNISFGLDFLFKGIDNEEGLKKRYKDLIKIFHPDNKGDTDVMQVINREYEKAKTSLL